MLTLDKAMELVGKLERTRNYPREPEGVRNLAKGLQKASDVLKVAGSRIVERCAETSEYCPADCDLLSVARDIRDDDKRQEDKKRNLESEWRKQYGEPEPFIIKTESEKIMDQSKEYWALDKKACNLMREECAKRKIDQQKMPPGEWLQLRIWAQQMIGLPVAAKQIRELKNWHGLPLLPVMKELGPAPDFAKRAAGDTE